MQPSQIVEFWFSEQVKPLWFAKDAAFDQEIRDAYLEYIEQAASGALKSWEVNAKGTLALIILLDQFPRNVFRDTPGAFSRDPLARELTYTALKKGWDKELSEVELVFLYMPLMHSEILEDQQKSVQLYKKLGKKDNLEFAIKHMEIIKRFGHFPHRNTILGRESTPEEKAFLANGHAGF